MDGEGGKLVAVIVGLRLVGALPAELVGQVARQQRVQRVPAQLGRQVGHPALGDVGGLARGVAAGKQRAELGQCLHGRIVQRGGVEPPRQGELGGAAAAFQEGDGEGVAPAAALGALFGVAQGAQDGAEGRAVVGDHRAGAGGGVFAHQAQELAVEQGMAAAQLEPFEVELEGGGQRGRHRQPAIGGAQQGEAGEQVVDGDQRHHVVAAGVDQLALAAVLDDVLAEGQREAVEGAGDGHVAAGGDGTQGVEIGQVFGAGESGLHPFADLGVEGVAGLQQLVRVGAGDPGAHAVAVEQDEGVVGFGLVAE